MVISEVVVADACGAPVEQIGRGLTTASGGCGAAGVADGAADIDSEVGHVESLVCNGVAGGGWLRTQDGVATAETVGGA